MSDYLTAQKSLSLSYDNSFEVVSKDKQKLQVAASGKLNMSRPDKLRATTTGGFANVEMVFDGKTFTIVGKDANIYAQADVPGTVDQMVDEIRDKYHKSIPGADLLLSNVYDELMRDVVEVKDLGSGVIGGKECDHLPSGPRSSTGRSDRSGRPPLSVPLCHNDDEGRHGAAVYPHRQ